MEKNCDLGLENATLSLRRRAVFSRPRSQFFTIRTSQPANNIYLCTARQCIHHMTCAISPRMKVPVKLEHDYLVKPTKLVSPFSFFFCFVFLFCLCFFFLFFFFQHSLRLHATLQKNWFMLKLYVYPSRYECTWEL